MSENAPAPVKACLALYMAEDYLEVCRRGTHTVEAVEDTTELSKIENCLNRKSFETYVDSICDAVKEDLLASVVILWVIYDELPKNVAEGHTRTTIEEKLKAALLKGLENKVENLHIQEVQFYTEWELYAKIYFLENLEADSVPVPRSRFAITRYDKFTYYAYYEVGTLKCERRMDMRRDLTLNLRKLKREGEFDFEEKQTSPMNRAIGFIKQACSPGETPNTQREYYPFTVLAIRYTHKEDLKEIMDEESPTAPFKWKTLGYECMRHPAYAASFYVYCSRIADLETKTRLVPRFKMVEHEKPP